CAPALRPAQRSRPDGHSLRLRARPVRRLHGAGGRQGGALVRDAGARGGRDGGDHDRGPGHPHQARRAQGRLHRRAGRPVRLLHGRHHHEREGAAERDAAADAGAGVRRPRRQSLPLREPRPRDPRRAPRRRQARRALRGGPLVADSWGEASPRAAPSSSASAGRAGRRRRRSPTLTASSANRRRPAPGTPTSPATPAANRFLGKSLAPDAVASYLAVHADGSVTIFVGKVDLGTGHRIAMRQITGDELGIAPDRIAMIEGDSALTPNQGATGGSYGVARGGMQLRQAAATARQALIALAASRLARPESDLDTADGAVSVRGGGASVSFADLIGGKTFNLKLDPKAPYRTADRVRYIGASLPRPDVPEKVTGTHHYLQDLTL